MKIQDIVKLGEEFCQNPENLCSNIKMTDDTRVRIGAIMGFLGRIQKSRMDRELEIIGLTATQVEVMFFIINCNQKNVVITSRDLENRFRVKNSTMSGILKRLEKKGLIERVADKEDRRNKQICIKGNLDQLCREIEKKVQDEFDKMFKGFTPEELENLSQLLLKLLHNVE